MACGFEVLAHDFGEDSGGGPDSDSGHRGQDRVKSDAPRVWWRLGYLEPAPIETCSVA